ncbi:MAG: glycosyltransferase family 2 protein [Thermodesulfobacteriota bacterium]
MPDYTVFIPVLDEEAILEANLASLLDFLRGLGRGFELIVGSNGSRDRTAALGQELARRHPELRFFHLPQKGPGRAFAHALDLVTSDRLLTLDMDLSTDLDFVPRALDLLEDHAVVVGSKRQGRQERSLTRVLGSGAYIFCARLLLGMPYEDYSIGGKGFRVELLRLYAAAIDWNTAYVGNLIYCAHRAGLPVIEIPVTCHDTRVSRFRLGHEGFYRFAWLGRLFWRSRLLGRPVDGGLGAKA